MTPTPCMVRPLLRATLATNTSGVYFLVRAGEVVYVGQAHTIAKRAGARVDEFQPDEVFFIPCEPEALDLIESRWIHHLRPSGNGTYKSGRKTAPLATRNRTGCYPDAGEGAWDALDARAGAAPPKPKPKGSTRRRARKAPRWVLDARERAQVDASKWWGEDEVGVPWIIETALGMCEGYPMPMWDVDVEERPRVWHWDDYRAVAILDEREVEALDGGRLDLPTAKGLRQTACYLARAFEDKDKRGSWLVWAAALHESGSGAWRRNGTMQRWSGHFRDSRAPISYGALVGAINHLAEKLPGFYGWERMVTDITPVEGDQDPPDTSSAYALAASLAEDWQHAAAMARGYGHRLVRFLYDHEAWEAKQLNAMRAAMDARLKARGAYVADH